MIQPKIISDRSIPSLAFKNQKEVLSLFGIFDFVKHAEFILNTADEVQVHLFASDREIEHQRKNKKYLNFQLKKLHWINNPQAPHMVFMEQTKGHLFKKAFASYDESRESVIQWALGLKQWLQQNQFHGLELVFGNKFSTEVWTDPRVGMTTLVTFSEPEPVLRGRVIF